ncbi:MAG TPA: hypothetical protein VKQ27_19285, partial [Acetobacteraceae bacterium]|nr:hypothetical protein [Acetobacteraceae bacterium]
MLIGELLDVGGRGVAQAIVGASLLVLVLLGAALLVPVLILTSLLPTGTPSAVAALPRAVPAVPQLPFGATVGTSRGTTLPAPLGGDIIDVARRYLGVP